MRHTDLPKPGTVAEDPGPVPLKPLAPGIEGPGDFIYAKRSHFEAMRGLGRELYGVEPDPETCDLKRYQDLLVLAFITSNVPPGSRILDVGGGDSRILKHLAGRYECWNVDKFEGLGNGPKIAAEGGYRLVLDYMGAFNPELPDEYFDFVFSISALEHTPHEPDLYPRLLADLDRVLKPGGASLHLFDVVYKPGGFWTNPFLPYLFENAAPLAPMPDTEKMDRDPDLYVLTREAYDRSWSRMTKQSYAEFGRPTSINVIWRKPARVTGQAPLAPEILIRSELPTMAIVTPSFNQAAFLEECIDSVLSQGYPKLQYVIMDGGSTDGSFDIIRRHERYLTFWRSHADQGQYQAVAEGFARTTGEIMTWLNSDDKHHQGSLHLAAEAFLARPDVEWIMGRPTVWDASGRLLHVVDPLPSWSRRMYLDGRYGPPHIQQESTFWRRGLWEKAGGRLDPEYDLAGDMELWSRFFRHARLHVLDAFLGGFRKQPEAKTARRMDRYDQEARRVVARERALVPPAPLDDAPAPPPLTLTEVARRAGLARSFARLQKAGAALTGLVREAASDSLAGQVVANQERLLEAMLAACEIVPDRPGPDGYLVSVLVSSYKAEAFMEECLTDLCGQSLGRRVQVIVVDAASPEREGDVVRRFQREHPNIAYVRTPERVGVYTAWNLALRLAVAPAVTPFSTNDRLWSRAYEVLLAELDRKPELALVYGDTRITDLPHQTFERHAPSQAFPDNFVWPEFSYAELLGRSLVGPHPLWRAWVHGRIGSFDEAYTAMADQEFWLRLGERFTMRHVPVFTGLYWMDEDALSNHAKSDLPTREKDHLRAIYRGRADRRAPPAKSVSVIIPVHDQVAYTMRCLTVLSEALCGVRHEVIVVDNASTDATASVLGQVSGAFRVLTNAENVGFTLACNQGAREAKGDYLLFLNNDTEPRPGFLECLLRVLEREPKAGAVGAQLVYPDGTVQEAGAVVFSDGTALNFGRGKAPSDPSLNRPVRVDYCSGACLLTPRQVFERLGGFDPDYAPGYYEETDYCFTLRQHGLEVYYEPAAKVIHHGSVSAGLDPGQGMRRFLAVNREKFRTKWAKVLTTHEARPDDLARVWTNDRLFLGHRTEQGGGRPDNPPAGASPRPERPGADAALGMMPSTVGPGGEAQDAAAPFTPGASGRPASGRDALELANRPLRADLGGLRLTVVSNFLPRFDASAANARVWHILRILSGMNARLGYVYFHDTPDDARYLAAIPGVDAFRLDGAPHERVKEVLATDPEILWLTNLWDPGFLRSMTGLMEGARTAGSTARMVLDTMDLHAKKYLRRHQLTRSREDLAMAEAFSSLEKAFYPRCDLVVTVSDPERAELLEFVPKSAPVAVIPTIHPVLVAPPSFESRRDLVFLGNMEVNHNLDAVLFFVRDILPRIVRTRPDIRLHILGRGAEARLNGLAGPEVVVHGYVQDLDEALGRYRLFVCPMTYGAGIKGKLGEAMRLGLPAVCTTRGVEGFGLRDGEDAFIADDPEEFAQKVLHLYDDRVAWSNFSQKGLARMAAGFAPRRASALVLDALRGLGVDSARPLPDQPSGGDVEPVGASIPPQGPESAGRSVASGAAATSLVDKATVGAGRHDDARQLDGAAARAALGERLARVGWSDREARYAAHLAGLSLTPRVTDPAMSIVVIANNPDELSLRNVAALQDQRGERFQLIFVDNGSGNAFARRMARLSDVAVSLDADTGAYLARNVGAALADAPILLFLEDDCVPAGDLARAHLEEFARFKALTVRGVYRPRTDSPLNELAGHYYLGDVPYPRFSDLEGNMSVDGAAFFAVGGWDDDIRFGHGGIELSIRLLAHDPDRRRQMYSPRPVIYHDYARNQEHLDRKRQRQAESWERLRRKHPGIDGYLPSWEPYKPGGSLFRPAGGEALDRGAATKAGERDATAKGGEREAGPARSLWNLAEFYRKRGDLEKCADYLRQAEASEGLASAGPSEREKEALAAVLAAPAPAPAVAVKPPAPEAPRAAPAPAPEPLTGQEVPVATAPPAAPEAPAAPADPGRPPDAVRLDEAVTLYQGGRFEAILDLAAKNPGNPVMAHMAASINLRRGLPLAGHPSFAALTDEERRLKLATARLLPELARDPDPEPRVHLIVLVHNRARYLTRSFAELAATDYRNLAVYIADNGSTDGSWELLAEAVKAFPAHVPVSVERFPTNIGRPAGHNWLLTGHDHSKADFIAIGDDDLVRVPADWLKRMVRVAQLFPGAAAVGGKALNPGLPRIIHAAVRDVEYFDGKDLRLTNSEDIFDVGQFDCLDMVDHVIACLQIYDRRVLDEVGYFDIRFSPCQMVDIDHHLRLRLAGHPIIFNGLIEFEHLRAMGKLARNDRLLTGNSLGNIVKLVHKFEPRQVAESVRQREAEKRAWLDAVLGSGG